MLKIRKHIREDVPYRVKWLNTDEVNRFIWDGAWQRTTLTKQNEWFDRYLKTKNSEFFTICNWEKPIWFMWLSNISKVNRNAELFIAIWDNDYRWRWFGKNAMLWLIKYAFEKLKLHKLNLWVFEENTQAVELYKKLGFQIEWIMKEDAFLEWRFQNTYSMWLLARDYQKSDI